jgi:hypothetical protein
MEPESSLLCFPPPPTHTHTNTQSPSHGQDIPRILWNSKAYYFVYNTSSVVRVPGYRSRGPGFDFRGYQILWEVVGLERGPLSLVSTIEELLGRNSNGSGVENREYGRWDPLR